MKASGRAGKCSGPNILVICGLHRRCKACIDLAVVHQGRLSPGEWVVVPGCGGVGLSAIMIAHAMGAQVIGVDINPEALRAPRSLGAAYVFNSKTDADLIPKIREVTGGRAQVAVMALGTAQRNVSAAIVVSAQNCAGTNTMSFVLVGAILLLVFLMPPARLNGRAQTREDLKAG